MRKRILLLCLLVGLSTLGMAQKKKDFILTLHKDTIFGKVKINPEEEHITFMHNRKRIYFHPKTLQAFGIHDGKTNGYRMYKSITNVRGKSMFVEVINEGTVKLYRYNKPINTDIARYTKNLYFIGKSDKKLSTITPDTYTQTMKVLVKDYPNLLNKVQTISYNEVPEVVEIYNQLR